MKKSIYRTPINNKEKYHPFFIIGSGRSGNTLLRRILNNHNELYIPPETYVLGKIIENYHNNQTLEWNELVDQTLSIFESDPEFGTFKLNNLTDLKINLRGIDKRRRSLATIINSFYEHYKIKHHIKGSTWGDKTPINVFCLDGLNSVFTDAKFIHIIRDPIDSINSYVKSGIYSNVNDAAERWVRSVELCCAFGRKNPNKYIEISYTDLVSNPTKTTKKLCAFLRIDFQKSILDTDSDELGDTLIHAHHANVSKEINTTSLGKGLKELGKNEQTLVLKRLSTSNNQTVTRFLEKHMISASTSLPLRQYIERNNKKLDRMEKTIWEVENSFSYKTGRAITLPARLIRDAPKAITSIKYRIELLIDKNKRTLKDKGVVFINKKKILRNIKYLKKIKAKNTKEKKLIISLTSFPERIPDLCFNIYSLINQNLQPDMLILWLATEQFPRKEKNLPKNLLDLRDKGLTIKWCSDLKSYKKLINTIKEYPNDIIVTADDDIYYPNDWLESLYNSYANEPNIIHCHRAHKIVFNQNGSIKPYSEWPKCIQTNEKTPLNFFTTGGGVLFPPNSLFKDVVNENLFTSLCPTADDIWIWGMAVLNNTQIKIINNNILNLTYVNPELEFGLISGTTLYKTNQTQNDNQLARLIEHYEPLKLIIQKAQNTTTS